MPAGAKVSTFFFTSDKAPCDSDGVSRVPFRSAAGGSVDVVNLPRPGRMAGLQARTKARPAHFGGRVIA